MFINPRDVCVTLGVECAAVELALRGHGRRQGGEVVAAGCDGIRQANDCSTKQNAPLSTRVWLLSSAEESPARAG